MRTMIRDILALLALTVPAHAQDAGLVLWDKIHEVFAHPRCANCHVGPDNVPMWSGPEYGQARPHGMTISGGASRAGLEYVFCGACHTPHNSQLPHGPPGVDGWTLAPVEMEWFGKTSAEVCAQTKDPSRNGGRTIPEVAKHVEQSELVHWGWAPGPGRTPAPYSAGELAGFLRDWADAGAPCPVR